MVLKIDRLLIHYLTGVNSFHSIWTWLWSCCFSSVWRWCVWFPRGHLLPVSNPWHPFSAWLFFPSLASPMLVLLVTALLGGRPPTLPGGCWEGIATYCGWRERSEKLHRKLQVWRESIYYFLGTTCHEYTWTIDAEEKMGRF